jgi:hypothetical protein
MKTNILNSLNDKYIIDNLVHIKKYKDIFACELIHNGLYVICSTKP